MPIGYFQFCNLISNRIPFKMYVWGYRFDGWFQGAERTHLETVMRNGEDFENERGQLELQKDQPIVLVCERGQDSKNRAQQLSSEGFLNVYYVLDGWQGLVTEHRSN